MTPTQVRLRHRKITATALSLAACVWLAAAWAIPAVGALLYPP